MNNDSGAISAKPVGRSRRAKPRRSNPYEDKAKPRKAIIYLRVSSEEQAQGHSLEAQERECREFLAREKPHWTLVDVYRDEHSAKSDKRPGFQAMLKRVYVGDADAIVAHHLDRFSRNLHQILSYFKELESMGVVMAFAKDQFDFSTEEGRLQFHILAVFADWYLRNLSRETKKGKLSRVLKGLHNNQPPWGYVKGENGIPAPVPEEADLIVQAYELYAAGGYTDSRIADFLNGQGARTRRGRLWTKDAVRELMQNEFYLGFVQYRGDLYPGQHEGVISRELFDRVQEQRRANARKPRLVSENRRVYILSGIARCAECGRNLRAQAKPHTDLAWYREVSKQRGFTDCSVAGKSIRQEKAEAQIGEIVSRFQLPDDWREIIYRQVNDLDAQAEALAERNRLEKRLKRAARLFLDGMMEDDEYEQEKTDIQTRLDQLAIPETSNVLEAGVTISTLKDVWQYASAAERRQICQWVFQSIDIDMHAQRIVRVTPKPDFLFFFQYHPYLTPLEDGAYQVTFPKEETPGQFASDLTTPQKSVQLDADKKKADLAATRSASKA
jgi:site-specific DNA recombinase